MNEVVVKTGNENVQGGQTGITLFLGTMQKVKIAF